MQYASYVQSSIDIQAGLRILSAEHPDIYHGHPSLVDEHFNCAFLFTEIMRRRVGIGVFQNTRQRYSPTWPSGPRAGAACTFCDSLSQSRACPK